MNLNSLALWRPPTDVDWRAVVATVTGPDGGPAAGTYGPLSGAFLEAFGPMEKLAKMHPQPAPRIHFLDTLLRVAEETDQGAHCRFLCQDPAQQRCIVIDVLPTTPLTHMTLNPMLHTTLTQ